MLYYGMYVKSNSLELKTPTVGEDNGSCIVKVAGAFDKIVIASVQDPLDAAVGVELTIV